MNSQSISDRTLAELQNLATLALLYVVFPVNLIIVAITLIIHTLNSQANSETNSANVRINSGSNQRTVLITGGKMTKALQLARSFHAAGHRVILVEIDKYWMTGHRFSKAVDRFYTVASPRTDLEAFLQDLTAIVKQEQVNFLVPVTAANESYYTALAKSSLPSSCEVFQFDTDLIRRLDDKYEFSQMANAIGLSVPRTFRITSPEQLLDFEFPSDSSRYIFKNIAYDAVHRLDMTQYPMASRQAAQAQLQGLPIRADNPWVLQEFIPGQEYCTHSTVQNGKIQLHCCSRSSAFQVNYEQVDHPKILEWVTRFVKAYQLTGQISFDFIEAQNGTVYAIECNPRTHSAITLFYNHPGVADAYLSKQPLPDAPLQPLPSSKPTYWTYHELWRLTGIRSSSDFIQWFNSLLRGKDAILQADDPLPFLMVHHWHIPLLLLNALQRQKRWVRIDFNIGKLVELGGD
ncbi:hypothetical protein NDI45_03565 [Leptolyngbya sp. GB1-A1]|uniref:ATP-grasp domain-containing protein n=1 Tax=Leptolyngbya sp. GB1-A1 TaxID=2933908 RepID=UPI003296D0F6